MAFQESHRQRFLQQVSLSSSASPLTPERLLAPVAAYAVRLQPAQVTPGAPYWRLIGIHHLTPDENRARHSVYVDVVDEAGARLNDPGLRLRWGWEGQRPDEAAPPRPFDKPPSEPATNIDIYPQQQTWVEIEGDGLPSDRVANLHSKHPDETGPNGELWNSIGHHSYYVVFQRSRAVESPVEPPSEPSSKPSSIFAPSIHSPGPAPMTTPVEVPSVPSTPPSPVAGNRLGFYLHISSDQDGLWEAIRQVQPPVLLVHADSANRMLLREIRAFRAPDAFVIGRLYKDNHTQRMMLTSDDPAVRGREMAEEILALDFGLATERGENGRLLIDAWMSLNEPVPGPASRQFAEQPAETAALLRAYDLFQSAFHKRLQEAGVEAVAFNFGAGNFTTAEQYLAHFPNTLASYTYLGFHEYGWPTLYPAPGSSTSAVLYRTCMEGIRTQYGPRHQVVITEAGLARMYHDPSSGDVGWLNTDQTLDQDAYWQSLLWYNQQLCADAYVVGACLFEVGHHGNWATFRHLGKDNQGNRLRLIDQIAKLEPRPRGRRGRPRRGQSRRRSAQRDFVHIQDGEFVAGDRALRFIGVNIRGLVHYGDGRTVPHATRDHIREQIQAARAMGVRVIRVFLPSIHADTQTTINRLRSLIEMLRAEIPDIYLLPALCNLYHDVEFRIPGDDHFYERLDPNFPGNLLNAAFFMGGYRINYLPFVQQVVQAFRDEPAIFAWEIGNELKLNPVSGNLENDPNIAAFLDFMHTVAQEIRRIDPNHLITTGMISTHHAWLHTPALRHKLYAGSDFDFLTVHCYNDERENDDSELARQLNKPFIVEEAGYGLKFGGDRSPKAREDMAFWFSKGARGYMPWGFMATNQDIGDGDRDSGLDRSLHSDWEPLFHLFRSQAETLAQQVANWKAPASTGTSTAQPTAFQVEQIVYSTDWLNIRKSPGHLNKLGDDILGMLQPAAPVAITGAMVVKDGLSWWPVQATFEDGQRVEGWAAEANAAKRLLSAEQVRARTSADSPTRPRGRGTRHGKRSAAQLRYTTTYVNLRRTPGYVGKASDDLIGQIPYGAKVEQFDEPATADALTWWQVRAPLLDNSVAVGWAAEIDPNGKQLLADSPPPPPAPPPIIGTLYGAPFQPGATVTLLGVTQLHPAATLSTKEPGTVVSLLPNSAVTIVSGPEFRGNLEWWQTMDSSNGGQTRSGWAPLITDDGIRLLADAGLAQQIYVARPFAEKWPISQGWGMNPQVYGTIPYDGVPLKGHNGLDFATPTNTLLLAADGGRVIRVDYEEGGFGHFVLLQHAWGESLYAHLERVDVLQGATVARGQVLGLSGNSGFSTGPHLHFGIRIYPYRRTDGWGGFVNPIPFLHLDDVIFSRSRGPAVADMAPELPGWQRP